MVLPMEELRFLCIINSYKGKLIWVLYKDIAIFRGAMQLL